MVRDFMGKLLDNAENRISALDALDHPWLAMPKHKTVKPNTYSRITEFLDFMEEGETIKKVISFP